MDDTCVLCQYCYNPDDHIDHQVTVHISPRDLGGVCDCGDPEAWVTHFSCKYHNADNFAEDPVPQELIDALTNTVAIALDYAIDIFALADSGIQLFQTPGEVLMNETLSELTPSKYGVSEDVAPNGFYILSLWNDQKHSFEDAYNVIRQVTHKAKDFAKMITYQVDGEGRAIVMIDSDLEMLMRKNPLMQRTGLTTTVRGCREVFREESAAAVIEWICDLSRSYLKRNYKIMRAVISQALFDPWSCFDPEKYENASKQMRVAAVRRRSELVYSQLIGHMIPDLHDRREFLSANAINHGAGAGIMFSDDEDDIFEDEDAEQFRRRRSMDDAMEGMEEVEVTDAILNEVREGRVLDLLSPTRLNAGSDLENAQDENEGDDVEEEDEDTAYLDATSHEFAIGDTSSGSSPGDFDPYEDPWNEQNDNDAIRTGSGGSATPNARVQYLIFFDIRLWKSLRLMLRDVYIAALVSNQESKLQLGRCYGQIYPQVAELYMLADREPECSIISSLSTQLFTTPSIATDLVKQRYVNNFLAALYCFFTTGIVGKPRDCNQESGIKEERVLKNRRFGQLFHDLEYLLNRNSQHSLVTGDTITTAQFCEFFLLFQSVSPMQRKVDEHVEYESESWIYFFNSMPYVLQLAMVAAQGIQDTHNAQDTIGVVAHRILAFANHSYAKRLPQSESRKPEFKGYKWKFGERTQRNQLPKFTVESMPVSLHHPLHVYISWLIENAKFESVEQLRDAILRSTSRSSAHEDSENLLLIFEHSIRVLTLLSQIQIGLWVRNGYSIRSQLHYYRDQTMRDPAFDRDIFMAQTALVVQQPSTAMGQLTTRFSLNDWRTSHLYDESQRAYIMETFLHHLIGFIMETTRLQGFNEQEVKKRRIETEIIQALAFKNMSFSDMCRQIPDQLTNDELLETKMNEMCVFKPPSGVRDYGSYSLKPEYFTRFDTHYIHFSAARIEEAEALIKQRFKEELHEPPVENITGPYANLASFALTLPFASLMWEVIDFVNCNEGQDALLGHALQLLHVLCCKQITKVETDQFENICQMVCYENKEKSIAALLAQVKTVKMYEKHIAKINRIFELLRKIDTIIDGEVCHGADDSLDENALQFKRSEEKKKLGQKRKAMIMAEFQRKQRLFAQSLNAEGMDVDEDEENEETNEWTFPESECIFCRMPDEKDTIFGVMGYVVNSNVERTVPFQDPTCHWVTEAFRGFGKEGDATIHDDPSRIGPGFPSDKSKRSCVVTGCGHGMHYHCYEEYLKTSRNRGQQLTRNNPEDSERGEFLCPLCRALNNLFLPVLWKRTGRTMDNFIRNSDGRSMGDMFRRLDEYATITENGSDTVDVHVIRPQLEQEGSRTMISHYIELLENSRNELTGPLYQVLTKAGKQVTNHMSSMNLDTQGHLYVISANGMDMNSLVSCLASSISTLEISLRNDTYGPVEAPQNVVQTLRVFAEYCKSVVLSPQLDATSVFNINLVDPLTGSSQFLFEDFVVCAMITSPGLNLKLPHVIRTFYVKAIKQALDQLAVSFQAQEPWLEKYTEFVANLGLWESRPSDSVREALLRCFKMIFNRTSFKGLVPDSELESATLLYTVIVYTVTRRFVFAFMRKVAIFSFLITGDHSILEDCTDMYDFDAITKFLGVESFDEAVLALGVSDAGLEENTLVTVYQRLLKNDHTLPLQHEMEFPGVIRLLHLPHRLDEFFNIRNYGTDHGQQMETLADPGVCLFCGTSVGMQTPAYSEDDSKGQCYAHTLTCGREIGMFLLPKRSCILLMKGRQGSFIEGPYLDLHGEVDETMRRGRPQFLQNNRYEYFTRNCWQQHGIANYIARKLDSAVDNGGWETL